MSSPFTGVMPAITTPFTPRFTVDLAVLGAHARFLLDHGCAGIVPCGSLGEGATLDRGEKLAVIRCCIAAAGDAPVVPGIAAASTAEAVDLAMAAHRLGCSGLMVLPPYVYAADRRELAEHLGAVIAATPLPCMLYNNPPAYRCDLLPEHIAELAARHGNLQAVKESSGDVRRIAAILACPGNRLAVGVGLDDLVVEGVAAGATFWIAGLADALPREAVALFRLARQGGEAAVALQRWFLPLLRFDTGTKFVQLIKLVQERCGQGPSRVRPPRLELAGEELAQALATIDAALASRPTLAGAAGARR